MKFKYINMFRTSSICLIIISGLFLFQCKNDSSNKHTVVEAADAERKVEAYAISLDGTPLSKWKDPDSLWQMRDKNVIDARSEYLGHTDDPKYYLLYARAYAENARIENAIDIMNKGIALFPDVADLYVYRGEYMLLGRQLTECIDNFWKAGQKLEKSSGSKGLIGMKGNDSIAGMTLAYRNYFDMALAFYCKQDMSSADKFFEVCGDFSTNSDLWIRSYYWQYACYSRSGRDADAKEILKNLSLDMQILASSKPYLDAMKYYKGLIKESDFVDINFKPANLNESQDWLIKTYAVGVKYLLEKNLDKALSTFLKIREAGFWYNPISLAAEGELLKISGNSYVEPEKIELNSKNVKKPNK